MACHQCGKGAGTRTGACSFCYKDDASLCKNCAWWEWGPPPDPAGLPAGLDPEAQKLLLPCPLEDEVEDTLIEDIKGKCALTSKQLSGKRKLFGKRFKTLVEDARGFYDLLYAGYFSKTYCDGAKPHEGEGLKYTRMMHTLLIVSLGTRLHSTHSYDDAKVSQKTDPLRRWQRFDAPRLMPKHLECCFFDDLFIPADKRELAQKAIGLEVIELVLKEKISLALAHQRLLEAEPDAEKAKELFLMALCIYHITALLWQADTRNYANFSPVAAYGYMSAEHRKLMFEDALPNLSPRAMTLMGTLYVGLDEPLDSIQERFEDDGSIDTTLTELQQTYLRSLPKMDNTGVAAAGASECEKTVRATLRASLKKILAAFVPLGATATREDNRAPEKEPKSYYPHLWDSHLSQHATPAKLDELIDKLVERMNSGSYWLETSCSEGLLWAYAGAPNKGAFKMLNETTMNLKKTSWKRIFKDCMDGDTSKIEAVHFKSSYLNEVTDNRANAREWYLDWRHDKDRVLYNFYDFPPKDLACFASFSLWKTQPQPKKGYGYNMLIFDPAKIRKRSVLSVNDYGRPCRSMLLVLHDLVRGVKCMDGDEPSPYKERLRMLDELILHLDANHDAENPITDARTRLQAQMDDGLGSYKTLNYWKDPQIDQIGTILELHMFGDVKMNTDVAGIVACEAYSKYVPVPGSTNMAQEAVDNTALITDLRGALPGTVKFFTYSDTKTAKLFDALPVLALQGQLNDTYGRAYDVSRDVRAMIKQADDDDWSRKEKVEKLGVRVSHKALEAAEVGAQGVTLIQQCSDAVAAPVAEFDEIDDQKLVELRAFGPQLTQLCTEVKQLVADASTKVATALAAPFGKRGSKRKAAIAAYVLAQAKADEIKTTLSDAKDALTLIVMAIQTKTASIVDPGKDTFPNGPITGALKEGVSAFETDFTTEPQPG